MRPAMGGNAGSEAQGGALREAVTYWSDFIARCIFKRLDVDKFKEFVPLIHSKHPLPPVIVADLFLKPQGSNNVSLDPRFPPYIQTLTQLGYVDAPSLLLSLHKYSALHKHVKPSSDAQQLGAADDEASRKPQEPRRWKISAWAEEFIFYHVIKMIIDGTAIREARAALVIVKVLCKWMDLFASVSTALSADVLGEIQNPQHRDDMESSRAAFVPLLLRMVESTEFLDVIGKPLAKGARKELSQSMSGFIHTLQAAPGFVERLEMFRSETLAKFDPADKKKQAAANAAMDELLENAAGLDDFVVADIPISNTRAGLYVHLNASLAGRPLIDDNALLSYIHNRYQGETQSGAVDLILASFDVLANAVFRNEGPRDAHVLKSFLVNKVPLLLSQLFSPQFSTTSSEFCITEALNRVDTSVFPTASLMFDESRSNNPYTESVREEFCTACALHGLVQREHVERILGETSMSYEPSLEKLSKDKLVQDCLSDSEKIQSLVRELDKMDGNVGAMCQALVEIIRQLCNTKETVFLRVLCSELAQKPQSLDILLLFEKLTSVLEPVCQLLDTWRYDDPEGEYQPIYEEFGGIMLLVLAFVYRYSLTPADIGITSPESGVAKILTRAHIARSNDELVGREASHMNGWIHGLFDTESGGLGDELMSSCPPQEFYLLVASIFQSTVVAYTFGYINDEQLKSGIEYVGDTFLLPSLVPALQFLSDSLWVEQKGQKTIIKILHLILLPNLASSEAGAMLSSVKYLIAKPLENSLRAYQKQDPKNQDIDPLLRALKDSLPLSRRTGGADHNEMSSWASSSSSGLAGAVKHTIQGLVQWSLHHGINATPASYTHRQLMASCRVGGTRRMLQVMLDEIRHQSEAGSASIVYDVVGAMICAPDVTNEPPPAAGILDVSGNMPPPVQRPLTLREVLRAEAEDCRKLQKKDPVLAEIVARLHRRVETHMALPQPQTLLPGQDMPLDLNGGTGGLEDAMAAAAAAAGVQGDAMPVDGVGLDMGMGSVGSDLGLGGGSAGGLDNTGDAELFGLDHGMGMFDGWESMDLSGS
ncbi:mediator complex subunit [Purpureocillium takamizusanense]|uniref:Mediator of RNA polymerase II transcription subunit 5 n=1 Tax=Purpureocillium takamizusanense TaxID=2060973 RepID=A0A9Q8VBQ0_9HYPO|nr:mediator complex subunit [Purpureocillium takamizusanense]UNI19114.1 mediator complex subunit [Purpureocillium takamizusanense]